MNYVLLPVAHGVELKEIQQDYAQPLIEKIRARLTDEERNYFVPLPYNYTMKTNPRQRAMYEAVDKGLGNEKLRYLKHVTGSDVTWSFILSKDGKDCFYLDFVRDMAALIDRGRETYPAAKVLCLGHSQGTQLLYSFFFDYQKPIDCFVSMGSPISMNSGAYEDYGKVPANLRAWINFYHRMDFIGSRFQGCHLSKAIAGFVVDYEVASSWWKLLYALPSWTTALVAGVSAHVTYWKSDFVAEKIAEKVKELIHQP